jgi:hypothetical protein
MDRLWNLYITKKKGEKTNSSAPYSYGMIYKAEDILVKIGEIMWRLQNEKIQRLYAWN